MAKGMKFVLNRKGVRALMRSEEMKSICSEYARDIKKRAGEGFEMDTHTGKNRVNAMVYADTIKAKRSNAKHNTLLKAVGEK
ncbi:MAG: hypothetical protein MR269_05540 [Clostridiales bacterium]|nr:hypothetical protein [Clostridiales bacterium]